MEEFSSFPPTSSPPTSGLVTLTSVSSDLGVTSSQREQRAPPHPLSFSESLLTQTSFRFHSRSESSTESSSAACDTPIVNFCPFWATSTSPYAHPPRASLYLQLTIHRFITFSLCSGAPNSPPQPFTLTKAAMHEFQTRLAFQTIVFYLKLTKTKRLHPSSAPRSNHHRILSNYFLQFCKCQSITMTDCLFISESRQMASHFSFHHHFRHVLSLSGNLRVNYSGHSFTIGAATSASRKGIPEHFMRPMDRGSPQMFHHYIRSDLKDLRSAQSHLK